MGHKWKENKKSRDFNRMMNSPEMGTAVRGIARKLGATYMRLAPVESGRLKRSVRVGVETAKISTSHGPSVRKVGVVEVTAPYAAANEFGVKGSRNDGSHALRRALEEMG